MAEFDFNAWLAEHRAALDAASNAPPTAKPETLCGVCDAPRTAGLAYSNPPSVSFFCKDHTPDPFRCLTDEAYIIRWERRP